MSNGDKKPGSAGTKGRRRNAARPPTIDGEAEEIEAPQATEPETSETAAESAKGAEAAATETEKSIGQSDDTQGTEAAAASTEADQAVSETSEPDEKDPDDASAAQDDGEPGTAQSAADEASDTGSDEPPDGSDTGKSAETPPHDQAPLPTARRASLIGSALVGALIALILYLGLYYGGVLPRDDNTELNDLAAQVEDLTRRASTMESTLARETRRNFAKDIADLEAALQELGSDPRNSLLKRVRGLEEQLEQAAGAVTGSGVGSSLLDDVQSKLAALETMVSQAGESTLGAVEDRFSDFEERLGQIESGIAGHLTAARSPGDTDGSTQTPSAETDDTGAQTSQQTDTANGPPVSPTINPQTESAIGGQAVATTAVATEVTNLSRDALTALENRVDSLDKLIEEMSQKLGGLATTETTASQDQVTKLETDLQSIRGELDKLGGEVSQSASGIDGKLAAFAKSIEDRDTSNTRAAARTTAKALALTALEKAADRGAPFERELSVLKPLVDDPADLAVLEDYAATGVPDVAQLQSGFSAVANTVLSAGQTTDGGILDTLASSARSLVQVRPIGQVAGDGPAAVVARIEAALRAGDLASAEAEWGSLDAAAQAASADWAKGLEARIAVNEAIAGLNAALTASLAGNPQQATGDASGTPTPAAASSGQEASTTETSGSASTQAGTNGSAAEAEASPEADGSASADTQSADPDSASSDTTETDPSSGQN